MKNICKKLIMFVMALGIVGGSFISNGITATVPYYSNILSLSLISWIFNITALAILAVQRKTKKLH